MKSKRKFPAAKPEFNSGKKLTQIVQTRTPIEALKMLRAGQPIDIMLGYFVDRGEATKDVFMMDRLEKLHLLEELKENQRQIQEDIKQKMLEHEESLKQQINETEATSGKEAPAGAQTSSPQPTGTT